MGNIFLPHLEHEFESSLYKMQINQNNEKPFKCEEILNF